MNLHNNLITVFDEKYFEDGVRNKVSAYENYHWQPERTIREASSLANNIEFNRVLDYGCAKGFMVYALRLLGKEAYGVDVSEYAINSCHPRVKDFVSLIKTADDIQGGWDLIIAKDVLEHVPKEQLPSILTEFRRRCKMLFIGVPLGDGKNYRIREYENDITHIIREPEEWWLSTIIDAGFKIKYFDYQFHHLKDKWVKNHPFGNAFIIAE